MQHFTGIVYTGGEEYYIGFKNGQHVLYQSDDTDPVNDIEVAVGHYTWCNQVLNKIVSDNIDFDMNL